VPHGVHGWNSAAEFSADILFFPAKRVCYAAIYGPMRCAISIAAFLAAAAAAEGLVCPAAGVSPNNGLVSYSTDILQFVVARIRGGG